MDGVAGVPPGQKHGSMPFLFKGTQAQGGAFSNLTTLSTHLTLFYRNGHEVRDHLLPGGDVLWPGVTVRG